MTDTAVPTPLDLAPPAEPTTAVSTLTGCPYCYRFCMFDSRPGRLGCHLNNQAADSATQHQSEPETPVLVTARAEPVVRECPTCGKPIGPTPATDVVCHRRRP